MENYLIDIKNEKSKLTFGTVSIIEIPNPFEPFKRNYKTDLHGRELREYLPTNYECKVVVNGELIEDYSMLIMSGDTIIYVPIVGSGGIKGILSMVAMVALAIYAPYLVANYGGATFGTIAASGAVTLTTAGMFATAGLTIIGGMLINAVLAPSVPSVGALPDNSESPNYSWSGLTTSIQAGNPIPILYGTHKLGGTVINKSIYYVEKDQYLKTLLSLCHGEIYPIESNHIFINDEAYDNFIQDDEDGKFQSTDGSFTQAILPNFGESSYNNIINQQLEYNTPYSTTTTSNAIDNFRVHIRFPQGLYAMNRSSGAKEETFVQYKIEYKKTTDTEWTTLKGKSRERIKEYQYQDMRWGKIDDVFQWTSNWGTFWSEESSYVFTSALTTTTFIGTPIDERVVIKENLVDSDYFEVFDSSSEGFTVAHQVWNSTDNIGDSALLDLAQYDIKVTLVTDFEEDDYTKGIPFISHIEEVNSTDFNYGGEALIGFDLKATEQLSGGEPNYNIIATRKPLTITKPDDTTITVDCSNPAWICYDLLTNKEYGGGNKILPSQMDYDEFEEWATFCDNASDISRYENFTHTIQYTPLEYRVYRGFTGIGIYNSYSFLGDRILIPISDVSDTLAFTLENLNKSTGNITFKSIGGDYKTIESKDITSIEIQRVGYYKSTTDNTVLYRNMYVVSWAKQRFEHYGDDRPTLDDCDITVNLSFETQNFVDNRKKLSFNGVIDTRGNVWETSQKIAKIGRGQVIQRGTKYSCVYDSIKTVTQLFTDENMKDMEFNYIDVNDIATEIEIEYADKDLNYAMNSVTIRDTSLYNDTYEMNKATEQAMGITSKEEALVYGRYLLANNKYIRRSVTGVVDIEAIACTIGDVVGLQSNIPQWGVSGRVEEVTPTSIILSKGITRPSDGNTYILKIRKNSTDEIVDYTITDTYNDDTEITINTTNISKDDLFVFGMQNSEFLPMRIMSISRDSDLTRKVTLVEYNETILDFDYENDTLTRIVTPPSPKNEITNFNITENLVKFNNDIVSELTFSWDSTLSGSYDIYYKNGRRPKKYIAKGVTSNSISIPVPTINEGWTYSFRVSDGTSIAYNSYKVLGKSLPPQAPQDVTYNVSNGNIVLNWKANTELDFHHYEVLAKGKLYTTFTNTLTLYELPIGTYEVIVISVDTSGNKSSTTLNVVRSEPTIIENIQNTDLLQKAFQDGLMTFYVGSIQVTLAQNYDIYYGKISDNELNDFVFDTEWFGNLTYDSFNEASNGMNFYYVLNQKLYPCTDSQVAVIEKMLGFVTIESLSDSNVRIFTKQPSEGQRYDVGDIWIQQNGTIRTCIASNY